MPPPPLRPAPERFAAILHALVWAVAKQTGWGLSHQLIGLISLRIIRIKDRFIRLAARIAAGTFKPRQPSATPRRTPETPPKPPPPSPLPTRPGWLLPLEKSAVHHRGAIEILFQDPEMVALMAAAPEAMEKVLRPLCRMLRLDLPPVLVRPKPERAVPKRARPQPRPKPAPPEAVAAPALPRPAPPPWPPRPLPK